MEINRTVKYTVIVFKGLVLTFSSYKTNNVDGLNAVGDLHFIVE